MKLKGKRIALFVADIYNEFEFWYPYYRMKEEGAEVVVIGPKKGTFKSKNELPVNSDKAISDVKTDEFDALIIPGGYAPDHMRRSEAMVEFVKKMDAEGKIIASICHAGWMLASADIIKGKTVTSFFAIKDDLVHAGAVWEDKEVIRDSNIITSRVPDDLPAFCRAIIDVLT